MESRDPCINAFPSASALVYPSDADRPLQEKCLSSCPVRLLDLAPPREKDRRNIAQGRRDAEDSEKNNGK